MVRYKNKTQQINNDNEKDAFKNLAKKFYNIMEKTTGYVSGLYILEQFKKSGVNLKGNPHTLRRIWQQVQHDFPLAIRFAPQSEIHWSSRPSGWSYVGPPQYETRRKRRNACLTNAAIRRT